jgi:hypothetical protein
MVGLWKVKIAEREPPKFRYDRKILDVTFTSEVSKFRKVMYKTRV